MYIFVLGHAFICFSTLKLFTMLISVLNSIASGRMVRFQSVLLFRGSAAACDELFNDLADLLERVSTYTNLLIIGDINDDRRCAGFKYLGITFIAGTVLQPDFGVIKQRFYSACIIRYWCIVNMLMTL